MHLINTHHWFIAIFLIIWKKRASANMLFLDKKKGKTNMFLEKKILQTSYSMANALNVLPTSHSFGDMILLTRASELAKVKNICLFYQGTILPVLCPFLLFMMHTIFRPWFQIPVGPVHKTNIYGFNKHR